MPEAILEIKNLQIQRNNEVIINDFSLSIHRRERYLLKGPIGAGKSTLLHSLMGFHPFNGEIILFNKKRKSEDDFAKIRGDKIGLLFQHCADQLFGPTVEEDVAFGLINLGIHKNTAIEKAHQQLALLGIEHLKHRTIFQLSGGEKTLTALAGVLIMEPDILLLDEPTNNLDTNSESKLIKILNSLDKAMLIVSHDAHLAHKLSAKRVDLGNKLQ